MIISAFLPLTDQHCWEHSDIFLRIWQKLLILVATCSGFPFVLLPLWISHMPAKGPAKYIFIPVKRYVRKAKFFLILCQNCAPFSEVKSIVFLQLHVDSSCSSSRQSNCFHLFLCGAWGAWGSALLPTPIPSVVPSHKPHNSANSEHCRICGRSYFICFLLCGGYCCSRIVDDLVSQSSFVYKFQS